MSFNALDRVVCGPITVVVPKDEAQTNNDITGTLYLNSSGYLYSPGTRKVVWWNFLRLTLYLSLHQAAVTLTHLFNLVFRDYDKRGLKDCFEHIRHLRNIAWSALQADENDNLMGFVERFAFAELRFNNSNIRQELEKPRSQRFSEASYFAKCMQPLFHKNEYLAGSAAIGEEIDRNLKVIQQEQDLVSAAINYKERTGSFSFSRLATTLSNALSLNPNPYFNDDYTLQRLHQIKTQLNARHAATVMRLRVFETKKVRSDQCKKYARIAVLAQMGMIGRIKDTSVVSEECKCGNVVWYRHDKICGILHRVECCFTTCWALDCFGCLCCIWPDAQATGCAC